MLARLIKRLAWSAGLATLASSVLASDGFEPPANPYLADSAWPMSHRTPYAQGSSPLRGPISAGDLAPADYASTSLTNITLATSPRYRLNWFERWLGMSDRVYWGSTFGAVYKLRANAAGLPMIDYKMKPSGASLSNISNATSGAYTVVDHENTFFTVDGTTVLAYQDKDRGNIYSPIRLRSSFALPPHILRGDSSTDPIVGMTLLWDGKLAIATKLGTVVVVSRDFSSYWSVMLGGAAGEEVSNSIAADEEGGIYVVTAEAMYRVQWTGSRLTLNEGAGAWRAAYENRKDLCGTPGRLGCGSGSTPSLMGSGSGDRFVVITDAEEVTNLVLFWRDAIPADWQQIPGTRSRRIAAQVPVNFGDPARQATASEQSVLVRGYGAVVVSNDYRNVDLMSSFPLPNVFDGDLIKNLTNGIVVALSGFRPFQPYGVHKFQWNPSKRKLQTAWVNRDTSCPNGIPTMSASSNMFYCIGARQDAWTVEGLDWTTGENRFHKLIGWNPLYNSFYAGTQIGHGGRIVSGTTFGVMELDPR